MVALLLRSVKTCRLYISPDDGYERIESSFHFDHTYGSLRCQAYERLEGIHSKSCVVYEKSLDDIRNVMQWLINMYPKKTIGLIIDYAPSIKKLNDDNKRQTWVIIEWIDKGLASVYQPGDIAINKLCDGKCQKVSTWAKNTRFERGSGRFN